MTNTLAEIQAKALEELDSFEIPTPADRKGCIGTPWTADQYAEAISEMKKCLIEPRWCEVSIGGSGTEKMDDPVVRRTVAVVAEDNSNGHVLCFDPHLQTFGLGWTNDQGAIFVFMYGDAVSTFLAR